MRTSERLLSRPDGSRFFLRSWQPSAASLGAVHIVHGLAEHSARYAPFAGVLADAGYAVYANDLPGHGRTAEGGDLGFFALQDGWRACLDDLVRVNRLIASEHAGVPLALFGHSMGSFLAQQFLVEHGGCLFAAVLSGSNGRPPSIAALARAIAAIERWRLGPRGRSALLQRMMLGEFNRRFEPARTPFDWLSRDAAEVDAYRADPLCGFRITVQLAIDLLGALPGLLAPERLACIPKSLPILVVSGADDPVGSNLQDLIARYRAAGLNLSTRLYPGARHELLHETGRDAVMRDLLGWLDAARVP